MININDSISPWQQLLDIYNEMTNNSPNPSGIAGDNTDPIDEIEKELNKANPDWNKIKAEVAKLQGECQELIDVATKYGLAPASCKHFIDFLKSMQNTLGTLGGFDIGYKGAFELDFKNFLAEMGDLRHDILQG